jgi:hypothetical protein
MKWSHWVSTVLAVLVLGIFSSSELSAQAQTEQKANQAKKKAAKQKKVHPSLVKVEETPGLPRVLLIGDSISMGYTVPVRELLQGKANVQHPPANCGPTTRGVESIETWLGDEKWDVIHFNFGLHDMVFFAADGKTRAEPGTQGARHQVSLEDYEKNLRTLVERLKKTNARLIWCSTTPVPEGAAGRVADEAVEFNKAAAKVMMEHSIETNDLHAFALPQLSSIQLPKNVHFTPGGYKVLSAQVAEAIETALKQ